MTFSFNRNIGNAGRVVRGVGGLLLLAGGVYGFSVSPWLGGALVAFGGFALFEALRGWCLLRACGIKTRF